MGMSVSEKYPSNWGTLRKMAYRRDEYTCQNCGTRGGPYGDAVLHAHHGVPLSKGGANELSNLTTYCEKCHGAIHHKSIMAPTQKSETSNPFWLKGEEIPEDFPVTAMAP